MLKTMLMASALCVSTPALAETTADAAKKWEYVYLGLSAVDLAQTVDCLNRHACVEDNPLFGRHPKAGRLIAAKVLGGAIHYTAFRIALKENPRFALRMAQVSVGVQGGIVLMNAKFAF